MNLIQIHNTPASPVKRYSEIEGEARDLVAFLDEKNGTFEGEHNACFGLHHTQVSEQPSSFFVIAKGWSKGDAQKGANTKDLWPSRVIINPKILEMPEKIKRTVNIINAIGVKVPMTREVSNKIRADEGCMSFPHRSAKKKDRYYRVHVEYQIPGILGFMSTKREWLEGLRAHIFQHEYDHDRGINMFWGDRVKRQRE